MSLTNTDPRKTDLFAKFPWPRVSNPFLDFSLPEKERLHNVIEKEKLAEAEIRRFIAERGYDLAAVIIETIQCEGGDNHFRGEWLRLLRHICDENDLLLIFDEVQAGMGMSGKKWCCQHFDVLPDLLVFGKKAQVCGVMAGPRLDEVKDNVFRLPSRINSTWGGNFCDFVRSTHLLRIIEAENLVENARVQGLRLLEQVRQISQNHPALTAVRGRGLLLAFDLPNRALRDLFWNTAYESGLLVVRCGERSIRLRPVLDLKDEALAAALEIIQSVAGRLAL
jgi:L-lysine 6-transaminase